MRDAEPMRWRRSPRRALLVLSALFVAAASRSAHAQNPPDSVLHGMIDTHIHSEEDNSSLGGGSADVIELARRARDKGMRAVVVKPMYFETATRAYLAQKAVPGIAVFGGLTLNLSVGGMNPEAVDGLAKLGLSTARVVWMPNLDAEAAHAVSGQAGPSVRISDGTHLLPSTLAVLDAIARHGYSLATSHASAAEALMLVRAARERGIPVSVTHAAQDPTRMTVVQMQEAARLGAYIEHTALGPFKGPQTHLLPRFYRDQHRVTLEETARFIRAVGAEHTILATDFGQSEDAPAPDGLKWFVLGLKEQGITDAEIDLMTRRNPARFLRLESAASRGGP